MKNKFIASLLLSIIFISCEKEVKLKLPRYESKLVINGELNNKENIQVEISRSIPILDATDSTGYLLSDASAKLYENNLFIGNMVYSNLKYTYNLKPVQGRRYKIELSKTGLPSAVVEVDMPNSISSGSNFKDTVGFDDFGFPIGQLTVNFKDNSAAGNYYQFSIRSYSPTINAWLPLSFESNDPVFLNNQKLDDGTYIFSDATFNGQNKSIVISVPFGTVSADPNIDKFEVSIKTFSEDYYRYLQQVRDFKQKTNTFDTEPVILKTNVTNGLGMVGSVYNLKDTIR